MVALLLAMRFRSHAGLERAFERRQYLLVSAAFAILPAMLGGSDVVGTGVANGVASLVLLLGLGACAAQWLRNASWAAGPEVRTCRNLALFTLAIPLVTMLYVAPQGLVERLGGPQFGVGRALTVLVFAYAILRAQILGLDVRVRWGISRGTVAGIFLGVFFVSTQVAQNYFQGQGLLLGGITAGLLIFAISPLQRLAERVADAAMPGVGRAASATLPSAATALDDYRTAFRAAMRDGRLAPEGELALARLAHRLGLGAETVTRLRHEMRRADAVRETDPAGGGRRSGLRR